MRDGLIKCYFSGWRNTFNYKGVATRKEFWVFILVNFIVLNTLAVAARMLVVTGNGFSDLILIVFFGLSLQILFLILLIIPLMSLGIRRMHDIGRSGWWFSGLLLGNIFILPAFVSALFTIMSKYYAWYDVLPFAMFMSLVINLSVISYLIYLCCKPSLKKPQPY